MFTKLEEYSTTVLVRLGTISAADVKPTPDQVADAARAALLELSDYRARNITFQRVGDNTRRFVLSALLAGPPTWVEGAEIVAVHAVTDADADQESVRVFEAQEWSVRIDTAGDSVLYVGPTISGLQTMRVLWTLPHVMEGLDGVAGSTYKARDEDVLAWLGAGHLAEIIARSLSDKENVTMGVDQIDHTTLAHEWRNRARELRKRALERLAPTDVEDGAGAAIDWDTKPAIARHASRVSH